MAELSLVDIIKAGGISKARDAQRQVRAQDYQPLLRQLPTTAAAALGPLLTSPDQNAVNQGQSMLAEYMRRRSPEARQGLELGSQQLANAQLSGQATQQGMELAANQDRRAEQSLTLDEQRTLAYIQNMSYDNAAKQTANQLRSIAGALKSEADLRGEYQKAPLLVKGAQAIGSWKMLKRSLDENNPMALQAAIVAAAQIQEPGLAVRNDDRIAYSGSNPVVERLVQSFNTAMSGEGLTPGMKSRLLALGTQLAGVHAQNILQVTDEYQRLAINTPGARVDQVTAGSGVDMDTVQFLVEMTRSHDHQQPQGR